ncbi:MAG: hypothetical protein WEC35_03310 [Nitrosopumilaceae archaeon]
MPTKPKLLPQPCPICSRENGTIQLVIFKKTDQVVCRIGHYGRLLYLKQKKQLETEKQKIEKLKEENENECGIKTRGKFWHSFRIEYLHRCDDLKHYSISYNNRKSITTGSLGSYFSEVVRKYGWRMMSNSSGNYNGRVRKHIEQK